MDTFNRMSINVGVLIEAMAFKSEEFVREMIDLYRSLPCLCQIKSTDYCNKEKKREAYQQLIALFKRHGPNEKVDEELVKRKIQGLRTVYKKELNRVEKSKKSGTGTDEVYVPTLWYYDLLAFTRDQSYLGEWRVRCGRPRKKTLISRLTPLLKITIGKMTTSRLRNVVWRRRVCCQGMRNLWHRRMKTLWPLQVKTLCLGDKENQGKERPACRHRQI
ncbi:uncharacterized protein [Phyllobates terribilis]|uniref:uncharacterized protein n=1 Tax=Phyllobates terribilis TaxID=111132 RepID=UPI003CCAD41A